MHVTIRRYQLDPDWVDLLLRRVNEEFVPMIRDAPGFLAYYALDAGNGTVASVSVFESQAGAEEANRMVADWIRQEVTPMLPNPPEVIAGQVGTHELNLARNLEHTY